MSRIGRQKLILPAGVEYRWEDNVITVKGPLGSLSRRFSEGIIFEQSGAEISLRPVRLTAKSRALWGTSASHLKNMIAGVTGGFTKTLIIEGIGFRVRLAGDKLVFALGFSHPVEADIPKGIKATVEKSTITIFGLDKEEVGQFAARIRALKKPEPYKGKGIRYADETILRKVGKRAAAAA